MPPSNKNEASSSEEISRLEVARERGDTGYALERLCLLRSKAVQQGDFETAGLASAHIVVCYKHMYQNTGRETYLARMESELREALTLPVSDRLKAVFWVRYSDIECERENFDQAETFCQQAYRLNRDDDAEVECLSRFANVKTMLGKFTEAEALFARAADILAKAQDARTFQRLSLQSGLLARRTRLYVAQKRYVSAVRDFFHGYSLAWMYRLRYGMPHRVKQYHRALRQQITLRRRSQH